MVARTFSWYTVCIDFLACLVVSWKIGVLDVRLLWDADGSSTMATYLRA